MGGRGARSGGGGGGQTPGVRNTTSLISDRERNRALVDDTLTVLRYYSNRYNVNVNPVIAEMRSKLVMAYYSDNGDLGVNQTYWNDQKMTEAYDASVASGFHPPRNNVSTMKAVVAHEMGHKITDELGRKLGYGSWALARVSTEIIKKASKNLGVSSNGYGARISKYGSSNRAEAIAEAFADVYCNGRNASIYSKEIVKVINSYFKR